MVNHLFISFCLTLVLSLSVSAQTPSLIWAKQIFGTTIVSAKSITTDKYGNVFTTGEFYGTVDFDPNIGQFMLTSEGSADIYITKFDSAGNFIWAKQLSGLSDQYVETIKLDTLGNIYTSGSFSMTMDFDPGSGIYSLNASGIYDAFISKLDSNGNFIWGIQIGGLSSNNMGRSITINKDQEICLTGYYSGLTDFDPGALTFNLNSIGVDIFIAKYNSMGQLVWANGIGGANLGFGNSINSDHDGNIYTTGFYDGNVDFDPGVGTFNMNSTGSNSMFIIKLNSYGQFVWAKSFTGTTSVNGTSIAIDTLNNIYTTGEFEGIADFDPSSGVFNFSSAVSSDIFISKLDSAGNFIWAKHIWGTGEDHSNSILSDYNGNLYLTGSFKGTCDFDPDPASSFVQTATNKDIFIIKLNTNGAFQFGAKIGGSSVDYGNGLAIDQFDHIYSCGVFSSTAVDFDPSLSTTNLYAQGFEDGYIMRLSHCGSLNSTLNINACNNYTWNGQTYTITGIYTQSYLNTNGCDSISQLNLILQNANIGVNQVGNLLAANASSASYQWIDCNSNTIIPGATNQSFIANSPGNYAVIITQSCTDTSNCLLVAPLNMNNPINSNSIILYPNPITNELILTSDKLMKQTTIRIKNFIGKTMLLKNDIHGNHFRCDISNFATGVYFLELIENESIQKIKFLKE